MLSFPLTSWMSVVNGVVLCFQNVAKVLNCFVYDEKLSVVSWPVVWAGVVVVSVELEQGSMEGDFRVVESFLEKNAKRCQVLSARCISEAPTVKLEASVKSPKGSVWHGMREKHGVVESSFAFLESCAKAGVQVRDDVIVARSVLGDARQGELGVD